MVHSEKGYSLVEVLIAIAIMGTVAVAFLSALATSSRALILADERTTAESIARSEIEYVKSQPFSEHCWSYVVSASNYSTETAYPSWWDNSDPQFHLLSPQYSGYSARVIGEGYDANNDGQGDMGIWRVTVYVYHNPSPNPDDLVLSVTAFKVFL